MSDEDTFRVSPCPAGCGKSHLVHVTYGTSPGGAMIFEVAAGKGTGGGSANLHWVAVRCPVKDKQFGIEIEVPPGKAATVDRVETEA